MSDVSFPSARQAGSHVDETDFDPFAAGAIERTVDTTEPQREVWLGDQLGPESSLAYNESMTTRLRGPLDVAALATAVNTLIERHQSLRATFSPDGHQMLIGAPVPMALAPQDLSALSPEAREQALDAARQAVVETPFALEHGPLFRAALYRLGDQDHLLMLSAHHAVCDGWSWAVIGEELGLLYTNATGGNVSLPPAVAYTDYAQWEADDAASPAMRGHTDYWLAQFKGSTLPVLDLPLDHRRPAVRTFASRRIDHRIDAELVAALRKTASGAGTSLFAAMFGAFAATLHRLTGQDDLVVGIAAAGQMASDMPQLVGHCVNLLPLRVAVDADAPFDALMRASGLQLLDAFEHQSLTYGALLKKLPVRRDASRLPLVSVLFNVDADLAVDNRNFQGLEVDQGSIARSFENFELFLNATPVPGGMRLEAQYNADLFDSNTVQRWLAMYECLLRDVARDATRPIGQLDVLSAAAAQELAQLQPEPIVFDGDALMHAGFISHSAGQPDRPALRDGERRLTYGELDQLSNRLARTLRTRGAGRERRVGICLDRSTDLFVALLAILKSGAAYVPLDPAFPQARLDHYASDARLDLLVTASFVGAAPKAWRDDATHRVLQLDVDRAWMDESPEALPPGDEDAQGEDVAYVIYTSGSTGLPKGVCVPHRAASNLMHSMQREPGIGPQDRLAAVTTLSFDMAVPEVMLPLAAGAEIVLVQRDDAMDGNRLRAVLEDNAITVFQATPGMWRLLIDAQWQAAPNLRAWIGAEPVPADLALQLLDRCSELWNLYGPTETTVWSTALRLDAKRIRESGMSIGRPIANTSVWIMDSRLQPCPIGVPGEICIGGDGVTLGYLDRPELTAERFVHATPAGKDLLIYRSGDRGRWNNEGLLEHMGRFDFQVKVRGYRIELGEIEAACDAFAGVARSVTTTREDQPGDVRLVAYLAPKPGQTIDTAALEQALRARLPQYMVPQHLVVLDALPLLPNGKLDRKALPAPVHTRDECSGERLAPRDERETTVLQTMEKVLNLPGMGIRDDFFAMGGHSLLAARLATLLSRHYDITLPLRTLFESPTAETLARSIEALQAKGAPRRATIQHDPQRRIAPLTTSQERIRFLEDLHPGRSVYNGPSAWRLGGDLDPELFETAMREVVRRQSALRTRMGIDPTTGEPRQEVVDSIGWKLPQVDLRHLPADQREAELAEQMQELADRPIDIRVAPMFHATLFRIDDEDHAFVFVPHHLVWDGWSFDLLHKELTTIYSALVRGQPHGLPDLPISFGDYAQSMSDWLQQDDYREQLAFWKQRFAQTPATRAPSTDKPRKAGMSGQGGTQWLSVDGPTTEALRAIARDQGVTINMLTFGIYALMMCRVIGSETIVIASPVRGRDAPETEPVMGFFNNVLPLAIQVDLSLALPAFMQQVKAELLSVMNVQQVPFERMVDEPEFKGRGKGGSIYQAMFSFQDVRERASDFAGLAYRQMHLLQRGATDDLGIWLMDKAHGLEGALVYNADIYLRETGAQLRERYLELLRRVVAAPSGTLAALSDPDGSDSAAYLTRLAVEATPEVAPPRADRSAAAMLLPEEAQLAQIWASVMHIDIDDIRAQDNFFDLGGDSLLAMRAVKQAEQQLGARIETRRYVFENLGQLAASMRDTPPAAANEPGEATDVPRSGLMGRVFGAFGRKK